MTEMSIRKHRSPRRRPTDGSEVSSHQSENWSFDTWFDSKGEKVDASSSSTEYTSEDEEVDTRDYSNGDQSLYTHDLDSKLSRISSQSERSAFDSSCAESEVSSQLSIHQIYDIAEMNKPKISSIDSFANRDVRLKEDIDDLSSRPVIEIHAPQSKEDSKARMWKRIRQSSMNKPVGGFERYAHPLQMDDISSVTGSEFLEGSATSSMGVYGGEYGRRALLSPQMPNAEKATHTSTTSISRESIRNPKTRSLSGSQKPPVGVDPIATQGYEITFADKKRGSKWFPFLRRERLAREENLSKSGRLSHRSDESALTKCTGQDDVKSIHTKQSWGTFVSRNSKKSRASTIVLDGNQKASDSSMQSTQNSNKTILAKSVLSSHSENTLLSTSISSVPQLPLKEKCEEISVAPSWITTLQNNFVNKSSPPSETKLESGACTQTSSKNHDSSNPEKQTSNTANSQKEGLLNERAAGNENYDSVETMAEPDITNIEPERNDNFTVTQTILRLATWFTGQARNQSDVDESAAANAADTSACPEKAENCAHAVDHVASNDDKQSLAVQHTDEDTAKDAPGSNIEASINASTETEKEKEATAPINKEKAKSVITEADCSKSQNRASAKNATDPPKAATDESESTPKTASKKRKTYILRRGRKLFFLSRNRQKSSRLPTIEENKTSCNVETAKCKESPDVSPPISGNESKEGQGSKETTVGKRKEVHQKNSESSAKNRHLKSMIQNFKMRKFMPRSRTSENKNGNIAWTAADEKRMLKVMDKVVKQRLEAIEGAKSDLGDNETTVMEDRACWSCSLLEPFNCSLSH